MGGITVDDFTSNVAYREIFGLGRQEGRQEGRQAEADALTLRQLQLRCGTFSSAQDPHPVPPPERPGNPRRCPARLPGV